VTPLRWPQEQGQELRPEGVEGSDPVLVGQLGQHWLDQVPLGLVFPIADVTPDMLLAELLQTGLKS
jgi:hypothetical protein